MNSKTERLEDRCPSCQHYGKGHIINLVTKLDCCTANLLNCLHVGDIVADIQKTPEDTIAPWSVCCTAYTPKVKPTLLARIFRKKSKMYCPICGKRLDVEEELGAFCSLKCATDYLNRKDKDED